MLFSGETFKGVKKASTSSFSPVVFHNVSSRQRAMFLRKPVQLDSQRASLELGSVLRFDRSIRRLDRRETNGAVAARAAVAADHDVGALDLAELVEERAELLWI